MKKAPKLLFVSFVISSAMLIVSLFLVDYTNPRTFQVLNMLTFLMLTIMNIKLIRDFNRKMTK